MNPLAERITQYLIAGGLFNPEQMEHSKVRDLLMECRTTINILEVSHGEHDALNTAREIENIRALTQIDRTLQIESILRKAFSAIHQAMTQPLDINKLARETARELDDTDVMTFDDEVEVIRNALTKLAADKDAEIARHKAALKVATDALKQIDGPKREVASVIACRALTQIERELKP